MIIIGTGSREWSVFEPILKVMIMTKEEFPDFAYFHGAQRGFDLKSKIMLKSLGHTTIRDFPYRSEFGKAGGMIRNQEMLDTALDLEKPEDILLIAMPLPGSIGTYGMINICRNIIPVRIYDPNGDLLQF